MEKYSRGRRGAPAKGVGRVTGARVQISPSPPKRLCKYYLKSMVCMVFFLDFKGIRRDLHLFFTHSLFRRKSRQDIKYLVKVSSKISSAFYVLFEGFDDVGRIREKISMIFLFLQLCSVLYMRKSRPALSSSGFLLFKYYFSLLPSVVAASTALTNSPTKTSGSFK